jgi:hypothetical protein
MVRPTLASCEKGGRGGEGILSARVQQRIVMNGGQWRQKGGEVLQVIINMVTLPVFGSCANE